MKKINILPDPIINFDFENVYTPSDDTYLLIDYFKKKINQNYFDELPIEEIKNILDLGTGSGIIAIFFQLVKIQIQKFNPKIYASDILKEAISCAKLNEKLNNIENQIEFIQSDLFKSFSDDLKYSIDIIVFNPPYLPSSNLIETNKIKTNIDYSWNGGLKGYDIILEFLDGAKNFLNIKRKSYIYFISSSRTDLLKLNKSIIEKGFYNTILAKKHMFFEDIILNRLELKKI